MAHCLGHLLDADRLRVVLVNAGHRFNVRNDHGGLLHHDDGSEVAAAAQRIGAHVKSL